MVRLLEWLGLGRELPRIEEVNLRIKALRRGR